MKKVLLIAVISFLGATCFATTGNSQSMSVALVQDGENWDSILNQYEQYVNKYIAVMKKVQDGDATAYTELASLSDKAQKLASKLEDAEDEMTDAQMARYAKITQKLAQAAANM